MRPKRHHGASGRLRKAGKVALQEGSGLTDQRGFGVSGLECAGCGFSLLLLCLFPPVSTLGFISSCSGCSGIASSSGYPRIVHPMRRDHCPWVGENHVFSLLNLER